MANKHEIDFNSGENLQFNQGTEEGKHKNIFVFPKINQFKLNSVVKIDKKIPGKLSKVFHNFLQELEQDWN